MMHSNKPIISVECFASVFCVDKGDLLIKWFAIKLGFVLDKVFSKYRLNDTALENWGVNRFIIISMDYSEVKRLNRWRSPNLSHITSKFYIWSNADGSCKRKLNAKALANFHSSSSYELKIVGCGFCFTLKWFSTSLGVIKMHY